MNTDDFEDLLADSHTRIGARQIIDDALRQLDPRVAELCESRLKALRERMAQEQRHASPDDDVLP